MDNDINDAKEILEKIICKIDQNPSAANLNVKEQIEGSINGTLLVEDFQRE